MTTENLRKTANTDIEEVLTPQELEEKEGMDLMHRTLFFEFKLELSEQELRKVTDSKGITPEELMEKDWDTEYLREFWQEFLATRGIDLSKMKGDVFEITLDQNIGRGKFSMDMYKLYIEMEQIID